MVDAIGFKHLLGFVVGAALLAAFSFFGLGLSSAQAGSFPGDNGDISFTSDRDGNREIFSMGPTGSNQTQLTNDVGFIFGGPSYSADATKIAFSNEASGENVGVYAMNADGSNLDRLSPDVGIIGDRGEPSYSPDGTKIAFPTDQNVGTDLLTMNADGTNRQSLNIFPGQAVQRVQPAWSPDGTKIAFASTRFDANLEIYVLDLNNTDPNTNVTRLTNNAASDNSPSWSPDGSQIAFTRGSGIFTMNADGSGQASFFDPAGVPSTETSPTWSPDGTQIAFSSDFQGGNNEVYSLQIGAGHTPVNLTNNPASDTEPNWAPEQSAPQFDFTGFFQPVDNLPTLNSVKGGQSVPVKFSLNGDQGLDIFAAGYPKSEQIACNSTDPVDGIEQTVSAGGSSLQYDAATDTYTYVWKTEKSWKGTCRQFVIQLTDGTFHRANFQFN